jgi:hypothetical protein
MQQRPAAMTVGPVGPASQRDYPAGTMTVAPAYQRDYSQAAPLPPQYNAPPQYRTSGAAPAQAQYPPSVPQYQIPGSAVPMTASRDPGMRVVPPLNTGTPQRLPPVNVPDSDQLAPNPPEIRR